MDDKFIEQLASTVQALIEAPLENAACANATAATTAAMLRILLQHLVDNRIIDGPALATIWQNVAKEPYYDSIGAPDRCSIKAQAKSDQLAAVFLNDLQR